MSRRATHKDIALRAGTSQSTVSLVLNNRDRQVQISRSTREAVLTAARELNYVPDLGARRLRHRLGSEAAPDLVLALLRPAGITIGTATSLIEAVQRSLGRLPGTSQLVLEEYAPGHLAEHAGLRSGARFHAAIITAPTPADEAWLEGVGPDEVPVPIVAFQRRLSRHASVEVDNVEGGALVTRHFLAAGRRRIAALTNTAPPSHAREARLEGYRHALTTAGLPGMEVSTETLDPGQAADVTRDLLAHWKPDAIVALSDLLAAGVLQTLRRAGVRVPEDVAVVGSEDMPFAPFLEPPLSSLRLPYDQMGQAAVEWLSQAVRRVAQSPPHLTYAPQLVVRESSSPHGRDPSPRSEADR